MVRQQSKWYLTTDSAMAGINTANESYRAYVALTATIEAFVTSCGVECPKLLITQAPDNDRFS